MGCNETCKDKNNSYQRDKRSRSSLKVSEKKGPFLKSESNPESKSDLESNVRLQKKKPRLRSISPKLPLKKQSKSASIVSPKPNSAKSISPILEDQENSPPPAPTAVTSRKKESKTLDNAPQGFALSEPHSVSSSKRKVSGKRLLISRSQSPFSNISK